MDNTNLNLSLPAIAGLPDPAVELRTVYLEEWIEGLPYADPGSVLDAVLEALSRFNRSPVRPALRFSLLEHYLIPYQYLLEVEEGHLTVNTKASIERRRELAHAARQVAVEMANGYKIVLSHAADKRGLFGGNRELRTALQRASLFLSFTLLHCYDEYLPVPADLWRELASLYCYAADHDLDTGAVSSNAPRPEFSQDISTTFKRAALTSLVDPYQLSFGDVWVVYQGLEQAAKAARIGHRLTVQRPAGFFVVDPDADRRPQAYVSAGGAVGENALLIDANPALELLRRHLGTLRKRPGASAAHDASLIGKMVRSLSLPPRRHTPRESSEGRAHVAVGVAAVHHLLGGAPVRPRMAATEIHVGDVPGIGIESARPSTPEIWEVGNEGPGGVGLIRTARPRQAVSVGELLGLQFPLRGQTGTDWSIGVLRWLTIDADDGYQAGVQLLGRGAQPVSLVYPGPTGSDQSTVALALPSVTDAPGATLLSPRGAFGAARVITVSTQSGQVAVRADSLLEAGSGYERFRFTIV